MSAIFDPYEMVETSKAIVRRPPGMVYNMKMASYDCPWDKSYPEGPARYMSVYNRIEELGLLSKMTHVKSRKASKAEILKCHSEESFSALKNTAGSTDFESLELQSSRYDAIYLHPNAYEAALYAAGSTIELVDQICANTIPSGFALVRPPGHHAMENEFCGYCFFNNAALAALHALDNYGLKKILIVDWDVHHGQATQQMFYDDERVLYFSIHRYEHGTFWPNLRESDFDYVGSGEGMGFNFNVPLNKTGMTDTDYMAIFHHLLLPVACEYQPELVIVSAGFDAAVGCPEGEMLITPACYSHLLWSLRNLAYGKLAVVLEGGYCLKSLAESAAMTVRALIGEPCPPIGALGTPCPEVVETINDCMHSHRLFWGCFVQTLAKKTICAELDQKAAENVHCPIVKYLHTEPKPISYPTRNCYPVQPQKFLDKVDLMLDTLRKSTQLSFAPNKVCFVYDANMMLHDPGRHVRSMHPEDPNRIAHAFQMFEDYKITPRCKRLESRIITETELAMVHKADYIKLIKDVSESPAQDQRDAERDFISVTFCKHSYDSACLAAGSLLQVVDEVLTGQSQSGVAIIRPPGHHAYPAEALGFCFLNNVALAARYAQTKYNLKRILILDWDVHHGNGTQDIFFEEPGVLYVSLHVYANMKFFPNLECSSASFVGKGKGEGFNVNIPWNKYGVGDSDYLTAFYSIILPIAYQFDPQLVIVSAGFDAAVNDSIGKCEVTPEAFGHMTHYISALANGKVILALEGGYNKESVATSLACCTKTLLGDPLPFLETTRKAIKEVEAMKEVIKVQKQYWPCLQFTKTVANMADILVPLSTDLVPVPLTVEDVVATEVDAIESLMANLETSYVGQEEACSMDFSATGELQEGYSLGDGHTHEKHQEKINLDILEFVEQYPTRGKLFSLEHFEAVHAAFLHNVVPETGNANINEFMEFHPERVPVFLGKNFDSAGSSHEPFPEPRNKCDILNFVERYPAGDKIFSLEQLEAIHMACINAPLARPCCVEDVVRMGEESNDIGCTSANCDDICAWRCGNCLSEICNRCKDVHAK